MVMHCVSQAISKDYRRHCNGSKLRTNCAYQRYRQVDLQHNETPKYTYNTNLTKLGDPLSAKVLNRGHAMLAKRTNENCMQNSSSAIPFVTSFEVANAPNNEHVLRCKSALRPRKAKFVT